MDNSAHSVYTYNKVLTETRTAMKPLKERLIDFMVKNDRSRITVNNNNERICIKLTERRKKKPVPVKVIYQIIEQEFGKQALEQIKEKAGKVQGLPVLKYGIKICEADTEVDEVDDDAQAEADGNHIGQTDEGHVADDEDDGDDKME
jgi:hypothetical protein